MKVVALLAMLILIAPAELLAAGAATTGPPRAAAAKKEPAANSCRCLAASQRVKLNLKPDTDLADLIAWIASITCKQFVLPGSISSTSKTVTIVSPQLITAKDAYRLFLTALDSVGLTVYPANGFMRVIEVSKAKTSPIPVVIPGESAGEDVAPAPGEACLLR